MTVLEPLEIDIEEASLIALMCLLGLGIFWVWVYFRD